MRGAIIHGVLLAVMLVYGYRTWTRDKSIQPNVGDVVLWNKSDADLVSIEYKSPKKLVKLERKLGGYWWGTDTTIETKVKPQPPKPELGSAAGSAGSAAGSAGSAAGSGSAGSGSGAGSGSAAEPPTVEEDETGRKTREFPLGEAGEKLISSYVRARALRDLGKPNEAAKKDYKLGTKPTNIVTLKDGSKQSTTLVTITFKDGARAFVVGGSVYGGSDKYAIDQTSGKAYVLSKDLLSALEIGETSLHLVDPRGFDAAKIGSVTINANNKTKTVARITSQDGADGKQVKTWGDPSTKKADQTAANFVDNANNLRPTEYAASLKVADLTPVMKLTYRDDRGALLGTLQLYRREKPGQLAEGQELDPANPPKGDTEYYIVTEKTRVPAIVRKDTAQRAEQDIETVFSGKQPDSKSIDPHGNPFGPASKGALGPGPGPGPGGPPGGPAMKPPGGPAMPPLGATPPAGPAGAAPGSAPGAAAPKPTAGSGVAAPKPTAGSGVAAPKPTAGSGVAAPKPAAGSSAAPKPPAAGGEGAPKPPAGSGTAAPRPAGSAAPAKAPATP